MTTLNGRLGDGVVANVLQYLQLSQGTGCLSLVHPARRHGQIYLEGGKVVCVEARPLHDLAALTALLEWREGSFTFRAGVTAPRRSMNRNVDTVLLEATYLADAGTLEGAPGAGPDTVLRVAPHRDLDDSVLLSLGALHLWRYLDGTSSLRQLAASSGKSVESLVKAADELIEHELVEYASLTVADPRFAREVTREAVDLLGPVGTIVVEDALIELGVSGEALPTGLVDEFVSEVVRAFPSGERRLEFARRMGELRGMFALDAQERGRKP
ncbi:MAG TPA: DUF4388 domain-containing protein [Trueperaceae bacterium]|nr:DUF4388 domain-containing protein [Trueperaceae bacterium]